MKQHISLPFKNLTGKTVRTAALLLLTVLLSFAVLAGTVIVRSLRTELSSLEDRIGADIMVVPYEATTKSSLENIVLQGNTGYFYMDRAYSEKILNREGIGQATTQFFLATASSGCCSLPVQIIGFDPETDFSVQPWIRRSYGGNLKKFDIVVGNDLNAFVGDTLKFYGTDCHVAAKLDKTGTSFDTTVFTDEETIKELIRSSIELNMNDFVNIDPEQVVSCVLINVAEGYSVEEVLNDINIHVKKVKAIRTTEMISGISDSLGGISVVISILVAAVWVMGILILLLAYHMSVNERKKEFAVLRVMGASCRMLSRIVMQEAFLIGFAGALLGIITALLTVLPFHSLIEEQLGLPFLLPPAGQIFVYTAASCVITVAVSAISASRAAYRISRTDPALILRGDNA